MNFEELKIKPEIIRSLKELNIEEPTDIQKQAIPLIQQGKDLIGISKTGSGKTAAFGIPILEKIEPGKGIQLLIMAPTRELADQISQEMMKFSKYLRCYITTIFGGVALDPQADHLRRADIVVGTPGRLLDHLNRRNMDLTKVKCVILDEADKMADMGFIEDIRELLDCTPKGRQMLLFGATISFEIDEIKDYYMYHPETINVESLVEEDYLKQYYYNVKQHEKFSLLVHLLKKENIKKTIVFCSTRSTVELLTRNLNLQNIKAEMIHGKLSQNRRLRVIDNFHQGQIEVLVASAVAARGLDIKDITYIFNYDLSQDAEEYVHRIGRTARAGEKGKAFTLLSEKDYGTFQQIIDHFRVEVKELPLENFPRLRFVTERPGRFGGNRFGSSRFGSNRFGNRFSSPGRFGQRGRSDQGSQRRPSGGYRSSSSSRHSHSYSGRKLGL